MKVDYVLHDNSACSVAYLDEAPLFDNVYRGQDKYTDETVVVVLSDSTWLEVPR